MGTRLDGRGLSLLGCPFGAMCQEGIPNFRGSYKPNWSNPFFPPFCSFPMSHVFSLSFFFSGGGGGGGLGGGSRFCPMGNSRPACLAPNSRLGLLHVVPPGTADLRRPKEKHLRDGISNCFFGAQPPSATLPEAHPERVAEKGRVVQPGCFLVASRV